MKNILDHVVKFNGEFLVQNWISIKIDAHRSFVANLPKNDMWDRDGFVTGLGLMSIKQQIDHAIDIGQIKGGTLKSWIMIIKGLSEATLKSTEFAELFDLICTEDEVVELVKFKDKLGKEGETALTTLIRHSKPC